MGRSGEETGVEHGLGERAGMEEVGWAGAMEDGEAKELF